jgi:hypothetical protein
MSESKPEILTHCSWRVTFFISLLNFISVLNDHNSRYANFTFDQTTHGRAETWRFSSRPFMVVLFAIHHHEPPTLSLLVSLNVSCWEPSKSGDIAVVYSRSSFQYIVLLCCDIFYMKQN